MTKIFICTPAYDGKVNASYCSSIVDSVGLLYSKNIQVVLRINTTGSLLAAERNRLTEMFLSTDCTHMMCIDSDLGWNPESILTLLEKDVDFAAGCYPSRKEQIFIFRPELNEDGSIVADKEKEMLEMQYIPAGFMLIKRNVIEKMRQDNPHLYFKPKKCDKSPSGYALFNTEVLDGEFWGEDYVFCMRARQSGFRIWVDPVIPFNHDGRIGALSEALTDDKEKAAKNF